MSGLVEKVKEVVRSRPTHSQNETVGSTALRYSSDQYAQVSESSPSSGTNMQDGQRGRVSERSFVDMNMTGLPATPNTTAHNPVNTLPSLPSNATSNIEIARSQNGVSNGHHQQERSRDSSMTTPGTPNHQRPVSGMEGGSENQQIPPNIIPDTDSAMKRKPVSSGKTNTNPLVLKDTSTEQKAKAHAKEPRSLRGDKHPRSTDVAPNDPSPLVPHLTARSVASPTSASFSPNSKARDTHPRDLRVPANFDLSDTEHTYVNTTIAPAVTQEDIHIQRTEVITQAIHRDVHIDHHFTYVQPILVREILPARHFRLDPTTGIKTEISAPVGYELPAHLKPRKAEEYNHLRQTTRHYVVDADHPHGQLELPPLRPEGDYSILQSEQNEYRHGSARV